MFDCLAPLQLLHVFESDIFNSINIIIQTNQRSTHFQTRRSGASADSSQSNIIYVKQDCMLDQLVNYNPPAPVLHNVDLLSCFRDQLLRLLIFNQSTISQALRASLGLQKMVETLWMRRPHSNSVDRGYQVFNPGDQCLWTTLYLFRGGISDWPHGSAFVNVLAMQPCTNVMGYWVLCTLFTIYYSASSFPFNTKN